VRLEAARIGSRWLTSREALQRFADALTPRLDSPPPVAPRTARQREHAAARADRELAKVGV